jgi:chromosome segregation ATPase
MSTIGRIFVVLNLILAAAFVGWASTALGTAQGWRTKHDDAVKSHETMLAEKEQALSSLEVKLNTLTEEQSRLRSERDEFEGDVEQMKTQLAAEQRRGDQLEAGVTKIEASLADYSNTIQQLSSEKERILERLTAAETARDEARDQIMAIEMEKRDIQDELRRAQSTIEDLQEQAGVAGS